VLLLGDNPSPADLPASILACNYAPYGAIFPQASAIVHQGGIGTTAQGLRSGRPTLVMPYSHDQPDNADRLVRLGVSRSIDRDRYRADRVVQELQKLLTAPSYRERAESIGRIVRAENGVEVACSEIERLLKQH
jgi:rhamnosyltransferase subunit B